MSYPLTQKYPLYCCDNCDKGQPIFLIAFGQIGFGGAESEVEVDADGEVALVVGAISTPSLISVRIHFLLISLSEILPAWYMVLTSQMYSLNLV